MQLERVMDSFLEILRASLLLPKSCMVSRVLGNVLGELEMFSWSKCWHREKVLTE